jgi:hypothetical protein
MKKLHATALKRLHHIQKKFTNWQRSVEAEAEKRRKRTRTHNRKGGGVEGMGESAMELCVCAFVLFNNEDSYQVLLIDCAINRLY